jgi:hypothetical protein
MTHEHVDETNDPRKDPRDPAFDDALRQALRAEDPGAAFTQRVLARAREERAAQQSGRPLHSAAMAQSATGSSEAMTSHSSEVFERLSSEVSGRVSAGVAEVTPEASPAPRVRTTMRLTRTRKLIAAIAASLTLTAAGAQYLQHRRYVAEGERARAQVLAALRLTNEKLNIVHDQITEREHAR